MSEHTPSHNHVHPYGLEDIDNIDSENLEELEASDSKFPVIDADGFIDRAEELGLSPREFSEATSDYAKQVVAEVDEIIVETGAMDAVKVDSLQSPHAETTETIATDYLQSIDDRLAGMAESLSDMGDSLSAIGEALKNIQKLLQLLVELVALLVLMAQQIEESETEEEKEDIEREFAPKIAKVIAKVDEFAYKE